jgi:hypothetical protein
METWKYSQQKRLADLLAGKWADIRGEPPEATRAFEAARRAGRYPQFIEGWERAPDGRNVFVAIWREAARPEEAAVGETSFYEGTPAKRVADAVEAVAAVVERIARVHKAPRPTSYTHDIAAARAGLDKIEATCGWWHRIADDGGLGGLGPRFGRYEGDPVDWDGRHVRTRVVRCGPDDVGAYHVAAQVEIARPPQGWAVVAPKEASR